MATLFDLLLVSLCLLLLRDLLTDSLPPPPLLLHLSSTSTSTPPLLHLSNVTFNLVQRLDPKPPICVASGLRPSGALLVNSQSLVDYHQLRDRSIGQRLFPPYSAKVTTKCDLQRKVGCVYTRAVYHPGSNLCSKHKRLPFMCSFFNSHVQTVCAFVTSCTDTVARGWRWFSIQFDIDVSSFLMINS